MKDSCLIEDQSPVDTYSFLIRVRSCFMNTYVWDLNILSRDTLEELLESDTGVYFNINILPRTIWLSWVSLCKVTIWYPLSKCSELIGHGYTNSTQACEVDESKESLLNNPLTTCTPIVMQISQVTAWDQLVVHRHIPLDGLVLPQLRTAIHSWNEASKTWTCFLSLGSYCSSLRKSTTPLFFPQIWREISSTVSFSYIS